MGQVRGSPGLALAGVLLLVGCGHTSTGPVTSTSGAASTAATSTSGTSTTSPGSKMACARAVEKAPTIAPSVKPHLVQICEKAASPDVATRRKAAREACVEVVIAAHIPPGPSRERALGICNRP
jgi:hypothetical protein